MDGSISRGAAIESYASREKWEVQELGVLAPNRRPQRTLHTGQVGYVITGMKVAAPVVSQLCCGWRHEGGCPYCFSAMLWLAA